MKKITSILALFLMVLGINAAEVHVTTLESVKANKCYTLTSTDFSATVDAKNPTGLTSTQKAGVVVNPADAYQQFAFVKDEENGRFLIYSVGAKKFVTKDNKLNALEGDAVYFKDASSKRQDAVLVTMGDSYVFNMNKNDGLVINGWGSSFGVIDNGNDIVICEVADFDPTEALKQLAAPAPVEDQWKQASTDVEANGIKFSNIEGEKFFYTIESVRQNGNARYASVEGNSIYRSVNPDAEANKWFFLRGKSGNDAVVIVNAQTGAMVSAVNGSMSVKSYQEFYLVNSQKTPGFKCITTDATGKIDAGTKCIDAANHSNGLSTGWCDDEAGNGTAWSINPVEMETVTMTEIAGTGVVGTTMKNIASYSSAYNVQVPAGVEVYTVNASSETSASLTKFEGNVLPANTGVVLLSNSASCDFVPVFEPATAVEGNLLKSVSNNATVAMGANDYVLANLEGTTQFYKATEGSVLALNKAYLQLAAAQANSMVLNFGGEATGIEGVEAENANAPIYDLSGRRVNSTVKGGLYIQNGKKFIVK